VGATFEGAPEGQGLKVGIAVSSFNSQVTDNLLNGALEALGRCGVDEKDIDVARVPGSFELPSAAAALVTSGYDAVICLGAIIKHETRHDEYIANAVANGLQRVTLDSGIPVVFGVLTTENEAQALARSSGENNRGVDAGLTAVRMANLVREIRQRRRS
jgi:6,7-dimethyl-8-ribityllumazine synthase